MAPLTATIFEGKRKRHGVWTAPEMGQNPVGTIYSMELTYHPLVVGKIIFLVHRWDLLVLMRVSCFVDQWAMDFFHQK